MTPAPLPRQYGCGSIESSGSADARLDAIVREAQEIMAKALGAPDASRSARGARA